MKKYLTLKNLGWVLTALVTIMMGMSGVSKLITMRLEHEEKE